MASDREDTQTGGMYKRAAAGGLWFLVGWFAGDVLGYVLGVGDVLALICGLAAASVFAGDPLGIIWTSRSRAGELSTQSAESPKDSYAEAA